MQRLTALFPNAYHLGYISGKGLSDILYNDDGWVAFVRSNLPTSAAECYTLITNFPKQYKEWWLDLVATDPTHVVVETLLVASIIFIWVSKKAEYKELEKKGRLTTAEEEELLREWKLNERMPLAPEEHSYFGSNADHDYPADNGNYSYEVDHPQVIVHKLQGKWMTLQVWADAGVDVKEQAGRQENVNSNDDDDANHKQRDTEKEEANMQTVLNFATFDFLGLSSHDIEGLCKSREEGSSKNGPNEKKRNNLGDRDNKKEEEPKATKPDDINATNPIKLAAVATTNKYGCGSCGPRGFYDGTYDTHLHLERAIADFMGCESAILYSDGASTVSSTIAAFCKRGDLVVVDETLLGTDPHRALHSLPRAREMRSSTTIRRTCGE